MWYVIICGMFLINEVMLWLVGFFIGKSILALKEPIQETIPKNTQSRRKHTAIKTSNYNDSYNQRYDIYKNEKTGLYEPQKPHRGIELKKPKEE